MVEQYSRFDLTKDVYAMLLVCSFFIWRFLLKNPNNFCAFNSYILTELQYRQRHTMVNHCHRRITRLDEMDIFCSVEYTVS
jgi:hypothetical protein